MAEGRKREVGRSRKNRREPECEGTAADSSPTAGNTRKGPFPAGKRSVFIRKPDRPVAAETG